MSQATDPTPNKLKRKDIFYFDLVVFQVEDTLFKLPKGQFAASSVFATIFTLPPGEKDAEGTEDKPFVLHGISEVDFESLLKLMYPPPLTNVKLTQQEWISVLKLCTMWEFTPIRKRAIQELSKKEMKMGTMKKIKCGKTYEVKEWVLAGYVELLKRTETITEEEAERLGWKTAAKLLLLREQYLSTIASQYLALIGESRGECDRCASTPYGGGGFVGAFGRGYETCAPKVKTLPDRNQHDFKTAVQKELDAGL